jgi:hypothetical protein
MKEMRKEGSKKKTVFPEFGAVVKKEMTKNIEERKSQKFKLK